MLESAVLAVVLLGGCGGLTENRVEPWTISSEASDSGSLPPPRGRFQEVPLTPPFSHANGIWAGVLIRDLNGDHRPDLLFGNGLNHSIALYENRPDGTLVDITVASGLYGQSLVGAVTGGDFDNDGDTDLFLSHECTTGSWAEDGNGLADGGHSLWENDGFGHFTERPLSTADADAARALRGCVISTAVFDLDLDGALDVVVLNGQDPDVAPPWIFAKASNEGYNTVLFGDGYGGFDEVLILDDPLTSFTAASWDVDEDGLPDLVLGQGGRGVELWRQDAPRHFVRDMAWGLSGDGLWMGLAVGDFDTDGAFEVYATNQGLSPQKLGYDDFAERKTGDILGYLDLDEPLRQPVVHRAWTNPFHTMLDGTELPEGPHPAPMELWVGEEMPGDDVDAPFIDTSGTRVFGWSWGAVAADIDADGLPDVLFTSNNCSPPMDIIGDTSHGAGPGAYLHNDGEGRWSDLTVAAGMVNTHIDGTYADGRAISVGDLDEDGDVDVVVANRAFNRTETAAGTLSPGVPHVWRNDGPTGHTLTLRFEGTVSNRDAIGTDVWVTTKDGTTRHRVGIGGTTVGAHDTPILVGLGDEREANVDVRFPSGTTMNVDLSSGRYWIRESGEVTAW